MGTRAIISVAGSKVKLFRHWDGYPEGVMPILSRIVKEFWGIRGHEPCMFMAYMVGEFRKLNKDMLGYRLFVGKEIDDQQHEYKIKADGTILVDGKPYATPIGDTTHRRGA